MNQEKMVNLLGQYLGVYDQVHQQWTQKNIMKRDQNIFMSALWIKLSESQ